MISHQTESWLFRLSQECVCKHRCAITIIKNKRKLRPEIVLFSREPFKDNIPMGNSQSSGMMFILTLKFLFLNMSREKWFNEPITATTTERRFKCFPKLIQTQVTKSETFRSVSEEIICEEDDEASCVEDWERVREDQKSWEWNSFDRRLLFQLEKMWEIINFHVHHHTIRCCWWGETENRSCKLIISLVLWLSNSRLCKSEFKRNSMNSTKIGSDPWIISWNWIKQDWIKS